MPNNVCRSKFVYPNYIIKTRAPKVMDIEGDNLRTLEFLMITTPRLNISMQDLLQTVVSVPIHVQPLAEGLPCEMIKLPTSRMTVLTN